MLNLGFDFVTRGWGLQALLGEDIQCYDNSHLKRYCSAQSAMPCSVEGSTALCEQEVGRLVLCKAQAKEVLGICYIGDFAL